MFCLRVTLCWSNSTGNFGSFRMCFLSWPLWRKHHALLVPVRCLSGGCVVRSCDFSFPSSLHVSAAAVISQDGEAADGSRFPTTVVQWLSTLRCSEDTAMWFQVILFDMLLVCWQGEVLLPCRRSEMLQSLRPSDAHHRVCLHSYLHYI